MDFIYKETSSLLPYYYEVWHFFTQSILKVSSMMGMDVRRPRSSKLQEITLAIWEGLFKVTPRKGVTCFTDGFKYVKATQ